jgi:hypothetical protein
MRFAILTASILVLGILVLVGLVHLVQELLIKEFFQPPSMPGENPPPDHQVPHLVKKVMPRLER